jgi:hypothetical protein
MFQNLYTALQSIIKCTLAMLKEMKPDFKYKLKLHYLILLNVVSGFRRDVDVICALLGYYAALSDNTLPTFRDNIVPIFKGQDGTETSRNVGKGLPLDAA